MGMIRAKKIALEVPAFLAMAANEIPIPRFTKVQRNKVKVRAGSALISSLK